MDSYPTQELNGATYGCGHVSPFGSSILYGNAVSFSMLSKSTVCFFAPKLGYAASGSNRVLTEGVTMQLELDTNLRNVEVLTDAVNELLIDSRCPRKAMLQIDVALDEIFSNISHYAYGGDVGKVCVTAEVAPDKMGVSITLEDEGIPFNPLEHEDPDVTLGVEKRSIGGLGIFLVRKIMDTVRYEYKDGRNRLTVFKSFVQVRLP